jgi:hypothetical protein
MKPEDSSPCLHELATSTYPEPNESSSQPSRSFLILSYGLRLYIQSVLFLRFSNKNLYEFLISPMYAT